MLRSFHENPTIKSLNLSASVSHCLGYKRQKKILQSYTLPVLKQSFYSTVKKYPTLYIHEVNTDRDHVHIQIEIPPNIAVSDAVRALKAESSFALQKTIQNILETYNLEKDGIWSVGYFSSTVGFERKSV